MWDKITQFLSFTGIKDKTVWQDILISSLLIPAIIFLAIKLRTWWNKIRPSRILFKGFLQQDTSVYIFHSEMSAADANYNLIPEPKYITRFPQPLPNNHASFGYQRKLNIDPVSSRADSECVADVFNILGLVNKTKNINIGDLINDWNTWSNPIFSIGFNPKTHKLMERCSPINFELIDANLKIKGTDVSYDSFVPNDAGIIQKTFDKESKTPVFILAGLGTIGTSAAGYVLKNNFIKLGKLYADKAFCVFFQVKTDEGKNSALIQKILPSPHWTQIILHPILYSTFKNKNYFFKQTPNNI